MDDLISRKKIYDYIKREINPYGKPFEGTAYELGLKIMRYIDAMDLAYSVDKVVEELEECSWSFEARILVPNSNELGEYEEEVERKMICTQDAIEIVKQGGDANDVCKWTLCDKELNVYDIRCRNPHILFKGIPKENNYKFCPYCRKKIKVVE